MTQDQDLYSKSEFAEIISQILDQELHKKVIISRLHTIKLGDGNSLFYVITDDNLHFIVDITGRKIQDNSLLFWAENVGHAGKIHELFYGRDEIILVFQRSKDYQSEFLVYLYSYGHVYPATKFISKDKYPTYSKMFSKSLKRYSLDLPEDLLVKE